MSGYENNIAGLPLAIHSASIAKKKIRAAHAKEKQQIRNYVPPPESP
jgi:hypothetical protein